MELSKKALHSTGPVSSLTRLSNRIVTAFGRRVIFLLSLTLSLHVGALSSNAQSHGNDNDNGNGNDHSADREVYDDDKRFEQLSGAGRGRLEHKYGPKKNKGKKGKQEPPDDEDARGYDGNSSDGMWARNVSPFSAVANTLVNDPSTDTTAQDTQSETTLVLAGGSNIVCGFNDSALYNGTTSFKFTGFSQSTNSGSSWRDRGSLPTNADGDAGDPVMAYSKKTGTILFSTLSLNTSYKVLVFRSVDNGASFSGPVNATPGFTVNNGNHDKEWIAVDNFVGPGFGNAYLFWRNFGSPGGMTLTTSTDDGVTWGPSGGNVLLRGAGQGAQVVVGTDHAVYCFWYDQTATPYKIVMRKSQDFGVTFGPTVTVTTFIGTGVNGDLALGGFRSSSFPQVVVNPVSGNLYIIYPDAAATTGGDRGNIFFRQSANGGTNWTAAVRVNDDTTTRAQFQPGIAVRPDGTGLGVSWYDRRRDPTDLLIERWAVAATISGNTVSFGPNFRISPQFAPVYGLDPVVNAAYMGDYDQMAADTNFYYTTWGDNRDQSIGAPGRKNANVRFARFSPAGPGPSLDSDSVIVSGGNGNALIDPNECNDVRVVIRNYGSSIATNILATLTSSTPGVTISQATASYPDAAPGAAVTNTVNFKVSTSTSYVCGTPVNLSLALNYGGGTDSASTTLPVSGLGYVLTQSSGATIVPGTLDIGNHGDDTNITINLPFSFRFYGQNYLTAALSSNGALQFGTTSTEYFNSCLPTTSFTDAIMPHWDDLRTDGTIGVPQGIFTSVSGTSPNRILNIEWRASYYDSSGAGSPLNFEVRLYENQSRIDLVYGVLNGNGSTATVGIQHGTTFTSFECNSGGLSSGLQLSLQPTPCLDGGGACSLVTLANFTANPTAGLTPLTTYFTNLTVGGTNFLWNFGDGLLSSVTNPVHIYTNAGNFDVSLQAIGPNGTNIVTRTNFIQAVAPVPPFFITQPVSQSSAAGSPVTFTAAAGGTPPLFYQWRHEGTNLPGATSTILNFPVPGVNDVGNYYVVVTNLYGSTNSATAILGIVALAGFGDNSFGQLNTPATAFNAIAIGAGAWHSLALRLDGAVVAWGNNGSGQCDVPASLGKGAGIAAGGYHSLALTRDQKVVGWGDNFYGQASPPGGLSDVIQVAAGLWHSLALKADGTIAGWGDDASGQLDVPVGLTDVIAIAAGGNHSLALKSDGTVVAWGENTDSQGSFSGQSLVPPGLSGVVAIGAGAYHSLALKSDGTIVGWGNNADGESSSPGAGFDFVALAGGGSHTLGLKDTGTVAAFGNNANGQCNISALASNITAVAAGDSHSLILLGTFPAHPQPLSVLHAGEQFSVLVQTIAGKHYTLEYQDSLGSATWTPLPAVFGNGAPQFLVDPTAAGPSRYYRVRQW